jgi:beta-1,2-mannosidase
MLFVVISLILVSVYSQDSSYFIGPFTRAQDSPIISPNPSSVFQCPLTPGAVHWEALHTFNPAAIVRNDTVYLFYRSEDDTGPL